MNPPLVGWVFRIVGTSWAQNNARREFERWYSARVEADGEHMAVVKQPAANGQVTLRYGVRD